MDEDSRAKHDICYMIEEDISGREWVCVRPPHQGRSKGRPANDLPPQSERHYMVLRWPNREKESA